jgi:hypothetical protein
MTITRLQQQIKELCPTLRRCVGQDGFIHHPLIVQGSGWSPAEVNKVFAQKNVKVIDAWAQKDYGTYVYLYERPYRVKALQKVLTSGEPKSNEEAARLVGNFWVDSENISQNRLAWRRIWRALKEPHAAMSSDQAVAFTALPETFEVYRGVGDQYYDTWCGLSWTVDPDKAHWFAQRSADDHDQPVVLSGHIHKQYTFAFFSSRNESEVVLLPQHIRDRKEEAVRQPQGSHTIP